MNEKALRRPDEAALRRVLVQYAGQAEELILRLAWQAGLNRPEMHALTWEQVDLRRGELHLPSHTVPLHPELLQTLRLRYDRPFRSASPYVILSDRSRTHPTSVHISRLASAALSMEDALQGVTLKDLRDDFVIRALTEHGKAYAMRVTGIAMTTLYATFGSYVSHSDRNVTEERSSVATGMSGDAGLLDLLAREGASAAGIALWLIWKSGLSLMEIAALTWDRVDLESATVTVQNRTVPLHPQAAQLLQEVKANRRTDDDPHVILTPKSRRPFAQSRLDVLVRTALFRAGLDHLHLTRLSTSAAREDNRETLLRYMEGRPFVMLRDVSTLLHLSPQQTGDFLRHLAGQGDIVRIGARYYRTGAVVPPEEHFPLIARRLQEEGASYRKDIAELLGVEERACSHILAKLVQQGKLQRKGQLYVLGDNAETE